MGPALKIDVGAQYFALKWSSKMKRFTPVMLTNGPKADIVNLLIWKVQVPLDKPSVGAASSREINCRGWKPLPHSIPLVFSG
ncbi:MAG: hypothetical protein V3V39_06765 [Desulfobacterales bacterium]